MAYLLAGQTLKGPQSFEESNSTQVAQQRVLSGAINRDYFGSNKRVWKLTYANINPTAFSVIDTIYQSYLSTGSTQTWQITDASYNGFAATQRSVHVDLQVRQFSVRGSSYISDCTLILTEA